MTTEDKPTAEDANTGFAVYDETILQFVTGVFPTKSAADEARPGATAKGHKTTVRKV